MNTFKIGYERLSQPEKKVYEQFERAFSTCSSSIDGNGFDRNVDVMKVLQIALGDNPNVIYFNTNHDWDINTTPACNSQDLSFYFRNQCYANNLTQLEDIFRRYARSKQNVVRAKISQGIAIPEPADAYLGQKLVDVAASVGRYVPVRYILNKGTKCFYAKFVE